MTIQPLQPSTKPVIVVGGGPVGLSAALELARFNIPVILLEKHKGIAFHPKTRNFNTRTMEIALKWSSGADVYHRLRGIDTPPGWKSPIRFFDQVTKTQIGQIISCGFEGPGPDISPVEPVMSSQDLLEQIILDRAIATGLVDVRFEHRSLGIIKGSEDDAEGIVIEVENRKTGDKYELEGVALVAADGYSSPIREQLQIRRTGQQDLHHFINAYFHADIESHIQDRNGVLLFVGTQNVSGVLQPLNANGRWLCQMMVKEEQWKKDIWTHDKVTWWVREATGIDALEVDVKSVGMWSMNATTADTFVRGRVILIGDAAHQFPPTGGLGVNTGLQGMHNVMWKLAYCAQGRAGWSLLDTYDHERRLPSTQTVNQSFTNHVNVGRINMSFRGINTGLDTDAVLKESRRYGNHLGVEFGAHYKSSAIVPDGTDPPVVEDDYSDYIQSATPGCRAPHVWLGKDRKLSTIHLCDTGFTVFASKGKSGEAWRAAAASAAKKHNVSVGCYLIGDPGIEDVDKQFLERYALESTGAVLVRPDGVVGFRAAKAPTDPVAAVGNALEQILNIRKGEGFLRSRQ